MIRFYKVGGTVAAMTFLALVVVPISAFVAIGLIVEHLRKIRPRDGN